MEAISRYSLRDDDELFLVEDDAVPAVEAKSKWKVLIVDDEPAIHSVTKLALENFSFDGKELEFLDAFSGKEGREILSEHSDVAIILLDVVMETEHAGLDLVRVIREDLKNKSVRIVLRTGQPGQAPEQRVIREYDINDYKEKTELTSQKLHTMMYATLRSYRDIQALECSKAGLAEIVRSSASIFEMQSMNKFAHGVLKQLSSLLHLNRDLIYCSAIGVECGNDDNGYRILAGTGEYEEFVGCDALDFLNEKDCVILNESFRGKKNVFSDNYFASFFESGPDTHNVLYVKHNHALSDVDKHLIEVFCRNVSVAFSNVYLRKEIDDTQREIVYRLGEAVESRSLETGNHVKRVAEYSKLLAVAVGLDEEEADIIRLASPMHDVGKVGIPDDILHNPSKLGPEQWEIMKTHASVGYEMLRSSPRRILKTAAIIAHEHHEKWNGAGYPRALSGEDIYIYGRITALADVFDALGSDRCYKKAWPLDKILEFIGKERGQHFDPQLVDILMLRLPKFLEIRDKYNDEYMGD